MKIFSVCVDASPKYPMPRTYQVEAGNFATAIFRAVKMYWLDRPFKGSRPNKCYAKAVLVSKILEKEAKDVGK